MEANAARVFPAADVATGKRQVTWAYSGLALLVVAGSVIALILRPGLVTFWPITAGELVQQFVPLVLISAFIERVVEVFLTPWRADGSRRLDVAVKHAKANAGADAVLIQNERKAAYRAETQRLAFFSSFSLGILISAVGVRALELFVDPEVFQALPDVQETVFRGVDVIVTAAVLGGGADGIHKIVAVVINFMDKTSSKITGSDSTSTTEASEGEPAPRRRLNPKQRVGKRQAGDGIGRENS